MNSARVLELQAQGLIGTAIASRLGLSTSYVYAILSDPDGSADRARKRKYERACVDCGGRCDGTSRAVMRCAECAIAHSKSRAGREARGQSQRSQRKYTDEQLLDHLRALADADGRVTASAVRAAGRPNYQTYELRFGSLRQALERAGLQPPQSRGCGPQPTTSAAIVAAIRSCATDLGREPTGSEYDEWARGRDAPSLSTARRYGGSGSWLAACRAALDPHNGVLAA